MYCTNPLVYRLLQQETMSRRGALIFKGDTKSNNHSKKSKKSRHHIDSNHVTTVAAEIVESSFPSSILPTPKPSLSSPQPQQQQQQQPHPIRGSGKIVVSGTVVTGYHTQFNTELQVGDAILIHDEMRIVTMRLSNTALNLSSALSMSSLSSSSSSTTTKEPVSYYYIQKPRDIHQERVLAETKANQQQAADIERHQNAFATTSSTNNNNSNNNDSHGVDTKNVLVYRERTEHGNYRIKRMKVDDVTDRSDLLELRSKKTSDKYC
jgi:hypothetical protein